MTADIDPRMTLLNRTLALAGIAVVFDSGAVLVVQNYDHAIGLILMIASTMGVVWIAVLKRAVAWLIPTLLGIMAAIVVLLVVRTILPTLI